MAGKKKLIIGIAIAVAALLIAAVIWAIVGRQTPVVEVNDGSERMASSVDQQMAELEALEPVQIQKADYELTYSGDLKDQIKVQEIKTEEGSGLEFKVQLSGQEATIFTMFLNSEEGDIVNVFTDAEGNRIPVAFRMAAMPEGVSGDDQTLFQVAQEEVNEIIASLVLK